MNDQWEQWLQHVGLASAYSLEADYAAENGCDAAAVLLAWEADRNRGEAERQRSRVASSHGRRRVA